MATDELASKKYLIDRLKAQYGEDLGFQTHVNLTDIADMIEDAPAVDAVPIIRCKNCTFRANGECTHPKNTVSMWDASFNLVRKRLVVGEDRFCSFGKERDNG